MRRSLVTIAVAGAVLIALSGCAREIAGVAQKDPVGPGVALADDGFGIRVGLSGAPVQIELFTEPQCDHCADLQASVGEDMKRHIESGLLAVTYRPLTFLDEQYYTDYSAVASNALFLTVTPQTTATEFQTFVEDLWANQDLSYGDFTDEDFADLAQDSGLSDEIVSEISAGKSAVDPDEMNEANSDNLMDVGTGRVGTPTVYDLKNEEIVDISESDWLDRLFTTA